jgi:hypothetical protein
MKTMGREAQGREAETNGQTKQTKVGEKPETFWGNGAGVWKRERELFS